MGFVECGLPSVNTDEEKRHSEVQVLMGFRRHRCQAKHEDGSAATTPGGSMWGLLRKVELSREVELSPRKPRDGLLQERIRVLARAKASSMKARSQRLP